MEYKFNMSEITNLLSVEKSAKERIGENTETLVYESKGEDIIIYPSPILALREIFHKAEIDCASEVSVSINDREGEPFFIKIQYRDKKYTVKTKEQYCYKGSGAGLIPNVKDSELDKRILVQREFDNFPVQDLFFDLDLWSGQNITVIMKDGDCYDDTEHRLKSILNKYYPEWRSLNIFTVSFQSIITDLEFTVNFSDHFEKFSKMV